MFFLTEPKQDIRKSKASCSMASDLDETHGRLKSYDFPVGMYYLRKHAWTSRIPFLPTFRGFRRTKSEITSL